MTASGNTTLQKLIESAFEQRAEITPSTVTTEVADSVNEVIAGLDTGDIRVATYESGQWRVNEWVKKAVLLSFRIAESEPMDGGYTRFYDKVPLKFAGQDAAALAASGARVVPPATVRRGAYVGPGVILMPSYVNIGAFVDAGTMVDTWATVGSCAQVGKNVHLSGGVGLGGVLEPLQAGPTIIEDDCFIGARFGNRRRRHRRTRLGRFNGGLHRPKYAYLRPGNWRDLLWPGAGWLRGGFRELALQRWQLQPILRGHRQKGRRKTRGKVGINELLRNV